MSDQGPEPLVLFLSLLLYLGFELSFRSMDFPADITLRKTRMKFELTFKVVLLFSYQGFMFSFENAYLYYHTLKFLSRTFCQELFRLFKKSVLSVKCELLYIITQFSICQEVFSFSFKILVIFLSKMSFSCATHIILS